MIFVTILIVISAVLLILVVLAQNPKGGGVNQFTGANTQLMGVKKTGDILEKLTWGFGIGIMVLSIVGSLILKPASSEEETEEQQTEQTNQQPAKK